MNGTGCAGRPRPENSQGHDATQSRGTRRATHLCGFSGFCVDRPSRRPMVTYSLWRSRPAHFTSRAISTSSTSGALVDRCRALIDGDVPAYVPVVRGGGAMHVRMLCLGRHWNGKTYRYEPTAATSTASRCRRCPKICARSRARSRPRREWRSTPISASSTTTMPTAAWGCTRTRTRASARLPPGCRSCRCRSATPRGFCSAASAATDPVESRLLESGDAFVFGGPARLRYHGVSRIVPGTAPPALELAGRFNLTFRQYDT